MEMEGPNQEQIDYWNAETGEKWSQMYSFIDALIGPLGLLAMERLDDLEGQRALDIGCGCGQATLELARRVGSSGRVTGLDISAPMLAVAAQRAAEAGLGHADFERADAQTYPFPPASRDALFSRFGVMFFADPTAAFANLRTALRPGGRLAFVCWRAMFDNEWMMVPLRAALEHVPPPEPPPPGAPGPFAFADADRVRGILSGAGFADVDISPVEKLLTSGTDIDATAEFMVKLGPTSRLLREVDPSLLPVVVASVRRALEPHQTESGVRVQSAAWVVTARNPE